MGNLLPQVQLAERRLRIIKQAEYILAVNNPAQKPCGDLRVTVEAVRTGVVDTFPTVGFWAGVTCSPWEALALRHGQEIFCLVLRIWSSN